MLHIPDLFYVFFCHFIFKKNKLYFIVYATTVPNVHHFPPLPRSPTPSGTPHFIVHVRGPCTYIIWLLCSLCCTLHPHNYCVTTNLCFLILSPFLPSPPNPPPSWQPSKLSMYLWLCFCSACLFFRFNYWCVFIDILFVIFLIIVFLKRSYLSQWTSLSITKLSLSSLC